MIVINSNGLIQLINQTGCRILGSDEDQLVGQPLLRYVHSESQEEMKKWISGDLSEDIDTHYESSVVAADQSVSHIMWRFSFMQDETGEGAFLLASGMDVTDKRELEQAIQMKEKLAAIGTMASGIAHDFNNILTAIYGYSQLAVDQVEKPAASKEFLFRVLDATERAKELVARLLSVSKPADNDFQPCDLEPILEEVIALSKATLPPGVKMAVELDSDLKPVKADSTQIHQLLMNLITNAGKAMQDGGGMLEVSAGNIYLSEDDLPAHSDLIAGDHIRLIVKDSGIGMKQELLTTIFDPFFSSTGLGFGNDEGTGLGLSIAHGVVSGHNGHISVESKPGIGSVFTVILPCCADNLIYPKKGPDETVDSEGHILIIDDEARVADVCRQLLKVLGYSTTCYLNPLKALEEFKRNPDAFDLVICDQKMPRMLGTELLDEIRKYNSTVPTILMSGNLSPLEVLDPATAYMRKPFTITDLKQHVTKSLTKKLERST